MPVIIDERMVLPSDMIEFLKQQVNEGEYMPGITRDPEPKPVTGGTTPPPQPIPAPRPNPSPHVRPHLTPAQLDALEAKWVKQAEADGLSPAEAEFTGKIIRAIDSLRG